MNYTDIIKKAVEKRDNEKKREETRQQNEVKYYIGCIKKLSGKIKELLEIRKSLEQYNLQTNGLYTDRWLHAVGFVKEHKDCIGVGGGGCCGEFDLVVNEKGVPIMKGQLGNKKVEYKDLWFLKRFVNDFDSFELKVKQFVLDL
jgi:ribosomal protein S18